MHRCSLNFEDRKLEDQFQNEKLQKIRRPVYYATFIFFVLNGMKALLEFIRGTSFQSQINVGFVTVQAIMAIMQALVVTNIMSGFLQMNFNEEATMKQEFYSFGNSYALFQAIGYFISDFRDGVIQALSHLTTKIIITSIHSHKVDPLCTSLAITSTIFIVLTIYVSDFNYRKQFLANISDDVWDKQLPFLIKKPYIKFTHKNTYFNITSCNQIEKFAGYKPDYCYGCNAREFLRETKINTVSLLNKLLSDSVVLNADTEAHLKCSRFNIRVCMYGFEKMNRIVILEKVMTKEKVKQFPYEFRKDLVQTLKQGSNKFQFLLFYNWGIQSCLLINNMQIKLISLTDIISKLNKTYRRYLSPLRIISSSKSKLQIRTYSNLIKIYFFQIYHILILTQPRSKKDLIEIFVKEREEYIEFHLQLKAIREFCFHYTRNIFVQQIERVILWERLKNDLRIQIMKQFYSYLRVSQESWLVLEQLSLLLNVGIFIIKIRIKRRKFIYTVAELNNVGHKLDPQTYDKRGSFHDIVISSKKSKLTRNNESIEEEIINYKFIEGNSIRVIKQTQRESLFHLIYVSQCRMRVNVNIREDKEGIEEFERGEKVVRDIRRDERKLNTQRLSKVIRRPMFWHGTHHHDSNDATKRLFDTVSSTVKGIQQINYVVEHDPKLTAEEKSKMKQFLIYRYDPADENDFPKYVSYYVDLKKIPPMYLDALLYIKDNYDSSLSLRRSCREGICGSCSMNCNGLHKLACIHAIDTDLTQPAYITPLGHMFVVKDLVVDMTNFYTQYKTIDPYLKRKTPKEGNKEYIQSVEDRKLLDGLYECVLCACCSTSCPSYWWHPDRYLGPAVLMQAYRWIVDSRDEYTDERLEKLAEDVKVEDCQNIGMCSFTCPKGLDPQRSMNHLMKLIEEYKERKIASATL